VRKHAIIAAVAIGALALSARLIAADDSRKTDRFQAELEGFQENPPISTTGVGRFDLRVDEDARTIEFVLSFDNLEGTAPFEPNGAVTAAHIHVAGRGVNGGVAPWLCGGGGKPPCPTPSGTVTGVILPSDILGPAAQGIVQGEPTAFDELVRAMREGLTYVNVHTTRFPGGEIRGQIRERNRD